MTTILNTMHFGIPICVTKLKKSFKYIITNNNELNTNTPKDQMQAIIDKKQITIIGCIAEPIIIKNLK